MKRLVSRLVALGYVQTSQVPLAARTGDAGGVRFTVDPLDAKSFVRCDATEFDQLVVTMRGFIDSNGTAIFYAGRDPVCRTMSPPCALVCFIVVAT